MDPHLYETMHGIHKIPEKQPVTSKLEENLNVSIDQFVEKMALESQLEQHKLLNEQQRRVKIRLEIQEALKMEELTEKIEVAMQILVGESENLLSKEAHHQLLEELINLSKINSEDIKISMSDSALDSILEIAIVKFSQNQYDDCLALLSLLTIVSPGIGDYWLRLGISAQKLGQYDLALRAYEAADELDPELIEAKLLSIECCIQLKFFSQAERKLEQVKIFSSKVKIDSTWLELIPILQEKIKT